MTQRASADAQAAPAADGGEETVNNPSELIRVSAMTGRLLEEVRTASLDVAGRRRMVQIHGRAMEMMDDALSESLRSELTALAPPFDEHGDVSEAELRVAQAQLVGWLDGLMVSLQAAILDRAAAAPAPSPGDGSLPGNHAYL